MNIKIYPKFLNCSINCKWKESKCADLGKEEMFSLTMFNLQYFSTTKSERTANVIYKTFTTSPKLGGLLVNFQQGFTKT